MKERADANRETTVALSTLFVKQQAESPFMRFKRITKENGSMYKSTWERVNSGKKWMEMEAPPQALWAPAKMWILKITV